MAEPWSESVSVWSESAADSSPVSSRSESMLASPAIRGQDGGNGAGSACVRPAPAPEQLKQVTAESANGVAGDDIVQIYACTCDCVCT
jgi:hypothetical protein